MPLERRGCILAREYGLDHHRLQRDAAAAAITRGVPRANASPPFVKNHGQAYKPRCPQRCKIQGANESDGGRNQDDNCIYNMKAKPILLAFPSAYIMRRD